MIGNALEFYDFTLCGVFINILGKKFFPSENEFAALLGGIFAFSAAFWTRPLGAILFGFIGDRFGRKQALSLSVLLMALSCIIIMANLPTYEQIGITAAWLVTFCRILQGLSSMGEIVGANIYLTEITKPPLRYPIVALTDTASSLGGMVALLVATLATSIQFNWRSVFWIGSAIALAETMARTKLRETPEFVMFKNEQSKKNQTLIKNLEKETFVDAKKIRTKVLLHYFMLSCASPLCFYITYFYCPSVLKNSFGYSTEQCIQQSFIISIFAMMSLTTCAFASYKMHPLIVLKIKFWIFFPFMFLMPYLLTKSHYMVFAVQFVSIVFSLTITPAYPILYKYIPVLQRFTNASFIYAVSRAATYIITSFGVIYITNIFSHYGLWIIMIPISIGYYCGVGYFTKLEKVKVSKRT